jgi:hypothetical protein
MDQARASFHGTRSDIEGWSTTFSRIQNIMKIHTRSESFLITPVTLANQR